MSLSQLVRDDDYETINAMIRSRDIAGGQTFVNDVTHFPPLLLYAAGMSATKTFEMLLKTRPTLHLRDSFGLGLLSYVDSAAKFEEIVEILLRAGHPETVQMFLCAPQPFLDRLPARLIELANEKLCITIHQTK